MAFDLSTPFLPAIIVNNSRVDCALHHEKTIEHHPKGCVGLLDIRWLNAMHVLVSHPFHTTIVPAKKKALPDRTLEVIPSHASLASLTNSEIRGTPLVKG